jgi:hypothetical protein
MSLRVRTLSLGWLAGMLLAMSLLGCAMSPADRAAAEKAWQERDDERALECARRGLGFVAGGCARGGP